MAGDILIGDPMSGVEIVREIERRFGVRLNEHRVAACRTVGDLYGHLLEVLGPDGGGQVWVGPAGQGPQDTPTLMALWRLRQALHRLHPGAEIRAETRLDDLGPELRRPEMLARMAETTGLAMPPARLHPAWSLGMAAPGMAVALHFGTMAWILVGGLAALLGFVFSDLIAERLLNARLARLPKRIRTVEDLARAAGLLNIGTLRREGGRMPERVLWAAYVDCLRTVLELDGPVEPDQRFRPR